MPMYRGLPDYVKMNERRYNFYEDPRRQKDLVNGIKTINKIDKKLFNDVQTA